jgi:hypothetical protein
MGKLTHRPENFITLTAPHLGAPFSQRASIDPPRQIDPLFAHPTYPKYAVEAAVFGADLFYPTDTKHQYHRLALYHPSAIQIKEPLPEDPSPQ